MPLTQVRQQIDAVDARLLELLNRRAELVHEVGEIKRRDGLPVYDPDREACVFGRLEAANAALGGRLPGAAIRAIYREIMSASYALEGGLGVAYLGPEGTYSHEAARGRFGASVEFLPQGSIPEVFAAVAKGAAQYGVVPIENSSEGAVTHTLDEFMNRQPERLRIRGQIHLKVEQNLLAKCPREAIRKIYSHPQSLGQCRQWLRANFPGAEIVPASSNTRAAQHAAGEPGAAAIAGKLAAELYGLPILEAGIQDCAFNTTRFLVIGLVADAAGTGSASGSQSDPPCRCGQPTGRDKTSLMFAVRNESGALFAALEPLNRLGISMSKIESRPSRRKAWEYYFFVDIDGHAQDAPVQEALAELEQRCTDWKILGSYPRTGEE